MKPQPQLFGLIGFPLTHSFSSNYFNNKFKTLKIDAQYKDFPIETIEEVHKLVELYPTLVGLNVTMPYKEQIIPYLNEISEEAQKIGAVNVVKIVRENGNIILKGYNTDVSGFVNSMKPLLKPYHKKALIFGTGGAAKAVAYGLRLLNIEYRFVSRFLAEENIVYESVTPEIIQDNNLIINTTPLGMHPYINKYPNIPYYTFTKEHLAYDLVYNPEITLFLKKALYRGAIIKNGLEMLLLQAEEGWGIWNRFV